MPKLIVTDELWEVIEPLLPEEPPKLKGGRPRIDDRAALTGIIFVLKTGIPWEMLPQEMSCGSGMTCWRRLKEWEEAGVWEQLHQTLLERLGEADQIDWERAALDSASVPAPGGGEKTGPNPTDSGPFFSRYLQDFKEWRDPDSNRGHHDFQSCALPTELSRPT